ncbi:MAG TPA: peptidoglycan-binding domain-containing protein [Catenuloplanes sp.]|jgi:peptidoglycan hydrolase-like protein with peptidoglycan-binding domain
MTEQWQPIDGPKPVDPTVTGPPPMARRQRKALVLAVTCAVVSTAGLAASTLIKSPREVAATTRAPQPSLVTATVERRVLASTVVSRGIVAAATQVQAAPLSSTQGATTQIVTAVRTKVGKRVKAGEVLLEVSGRPLVVLTGPVPAYRDLKPADKGRDVAALQEALGSLGHYRGGDRDGSFGPATKRAVLRLYAAIGYDAPDTGGPGGSRDREALASAETAVEEARRQVTAMRRRIAAGATAGRAEEPLTEQVTYLIQSRERAERSYSDLVSRTGPMLPMAEVIFVPGLPAQVSQLAAKLGQQVQAPLVTLAVGELTVLAKLTPEVAKLVKPAMSAQIVAEALGTEVTAAVASVGTVTTEDVAGPVGSEAAGNAKAAPATGPPYAPVTVRPRKALPPAWAGQDVRVTISAAQTAGPMLVVPLSAVSSGADGRTTVARLGDNQQVSRVEVVAGASGDGFVAVNVANDALAEGDLVVIGG